MNETMESTIIISILSLVVSLGVFVTSVTIFPFSYLLLFVCPYLQSYTNCNY